MFVGPKMMNGIENHVLTLALCGGFLFMAFLHGATLCSTFVGRDAVFRSPQAMKFELFANLPLEYVFLVSSHFVFLAFVIVFVFVLPTLFFDLWRWGSYGLDFIFFASAVVTVAAVAVAFSTVFSTIVVTAVVFVSSTARRVGVVIHG